MAELINDENLSLEISTNAAISLSLIFVSSRDEDVINTILTSLMIFGEKTLENPMALFFSVALGIQFLGEQDKCETVLETLDSIEKPLSKLAKVVVESCAYIGSGNILKINEFMSKLNKKIDPEDD